MQALCCLRTDERKPALRSGHATGGGHALHRQGRRRAGDQRPGQAIAVNFESADAPSPDTGVNIMMMQRRQPNCLYQREPVQEDFLVLHAECLAIVHGEERAMRQSDDLGKRRAWSLAFRGSSSERPRHHGFGG
jgi:hypothetical protein